MCAYSKERVRLRDVRREPQFEEEMAAIEPSVRRADEFLHGAEWLLARDPARCGRPVEFDSSVWRMVTDDSANMDPLVIYYTFDDDAVCLLSIEVANGTGL